MKRRDFLKLPSLGAAVASGLGLSACNDNDSLNPPPVVPKPPFDLEKHQPPKVYSKDGVLNFTLETKFANPVVNGITLNYRTYNGSFPSHTWMVKPGDSLRIHLINNFPALSEEDISHASENINVPHGFNNTNLHVHGLNVSPEGRADNVLLDIAPSEWTPERVAGLENTVLTEFQYEINIPSDHPAGTYWYHPHKHGSSFPQLASGMAGFLVIEGGEGDLGQLPELKNAKTIDLAFNELIFNAIGEMPGVNPSANDRYPIHSLFSFQAMMQYTINGLAVNEGESFTDCTGAKPPFLRMRPGEVQRWRLGMMCHLQTYKLALTGHDIQVAAWDGLTDFALETYNEERPLEISPGNRVEIIVKASDTPGTYPFKMMMVAFGEFPLFLTPGFCGGEARPDMTMFNVVVEGTPVNMPLPTVLNPPLNRLPDIRDEEITRRRKIEFQIVGDVMYDWTTFQFLEDTRQFYINNLKFNANRINETMLLGTAEEWEIINIHPGHNSSLHVNHPFHLHVNWIQVMEIHHADGRIDYPNEGRGRWMDNIDVPFRGKAVVRIRFQKFPGIAPFHCHILAHEDEGMMYLTEVVDPRPVSKRITLLEGGVLSSADTAKRLAAARFRPGSFAEDTDVTYRYKLDIHHPAGEGMLGLERYFRLSSELELAKPATLVINFPLELSKGEKYDPATVKLYRSTGSGWTTDGITTVSLDTANHKLTSRVSTLGNGHFAVLATLVSGPVTTPTLDSH